MNQFTNHKKLIEALDFRIESIEESKKALEDSLTNESERFQKEKRKKYYSNVAYFVHTIWEHYELGILFNELLLYNLKLKEHKDYFHAINDINQSIKSVASQLLLHPNFISFEKKYGKIGWRNPFGLSPIHMEIKTLLERLKDIENEKLNITYGSLYDIFIGGMNSILGRWWEISVRGFEKITPELDLYDKNLRVLFFYEGFQHDYLGVGDAVQLQIIYLNMNPKFFPSATDEIVLNKLLNAGDWYSEAHLLLSYCEKIKKYFIQKLNTKFPIEASMQRFKHYMELYYTGSISGKSEKIFQKEFEYFMFNNGYFAISEGQVGNARYDDIVLNENNAFLFEHKRISLSDSKRKLVRKIQGAKIQTKIYHDRLGFFPGLSHDVYIVLFSDYYLKFKDGISEILKDGLNFKFVLICLNKISSSTVKKVEDIDIKELIE